MFLFCLFIRRNIINYVSDKLTSSSSSLFLLMSSTSSSLSNVFFASAKVGKTLYQRKLLKLISLALPHICICDRNERKMYVYVYIMRTFFPSARRWLSLNGLGVDIDTDTQNYGEMILIIDFQLGKELS